MAITYVGGQVAGRAGATSTTTVTYALTGGTNSTPQAGDLVIVTMVVGSQARNPAQAITTPATWTALGQLNPNTTTYDTSMNVSYKFMPATPDTNFTAPSTGNVADAQRWTVQVFRGVDPTNPLDVAAVSATGTATSRCDPGSITPTTAGAYVLICGGGAAATGAAYVAPANYTTNFLTGFTADTNDALVGSGYRAWTSGAEDPAVYTGGSTATTSSWAAYTIALRPAANNYTLTAQGGSYSLTGGSAILKRSKLLTASGGSYSLTGSSVVLSYTSLIPIRISTTIWRQDTLGTSGTPGAKAITVPADAQGVVVQFHSGQSGTPQTLSISSDFAGTFTIANSTTQNGCSLGYAVVSSTGAKNLTLSWTRSLAEGPSVYISFIKNINTADWVREVAVVGNDTNGTSATNVFDTSTTDLLLVVNDQDGGTVPTTISGFTSLATTDGTYSLPSRLQSCDAPGATTTTVTGTTTNFNVLSGISIKYGVTSTGYTLTAQGGSYTVTGSSAILKRNRVLTPTGGTYTMSGGTATLRRTKLLVASGGSYSVTGSPAFLTRSKQLSLQGGSYSITGGTATLLKSKVLVASGGTYTYVGSNANIVYTPATVAYTLTAQGGSYNLSGSSAVLKRSRLLTSSGGSYSVTGQQATVHKSKLLIASGGSYILTGQQAVLSRNRQLSALGGAYNVAGGSIVIQKSGLVWPLPEQVLLGIQYGPTGVDYTGTLDVMGIKFDITTGQLVKPISNKVVMTL